MKVGFTGTQLGMTTIQGAVLFSYFRGMSIEEFHHGDCVGADAEAHQLAIESNIPVIIHPPSYGGKRAFCSGFAESRVEKPYLERNADIVDETDVMFATPRGFTEEVRSGTWATIRYARKRRRPLYVIFPDGRVSVENA